MPRRNDIHKIMIIGSGPIVIGQACEFDYSGTQACKALRALGYRIVLVNSNPATIMTDPGMADVTYIEPLNLNRMIQIIEEERPDALLPNLGGQSGLNLCSELARSGALERCGVKVIGVQVDAIERGEDRIAFKDTMNSLGIEMPRSAPAERFPSSRTLAVRAYRKVPYTTWTRARLRSSPKRTSKTSTSDSRNTSSTSASHSSVPATISRG